MTQSSVGSNQYLEARIDGGAKQDAVSQTKPTLRSNRADFMAGDLSRERDGKRLVK